MIDCRIKLYASLKEAAGQSTIDVSCPAPLTAASLLSCIAERYPQLAAGLPTAVVAVNRTFADPDTPITPGDEIALFPPVSGGSDLPYPTHFALSETPPDLLAIQAKLQQPDVGAIVSFSGAVRGQTRREGMPEETVHLEYEAYSEMALDKMGQIAREIWERWPRVKGIAIVQRIGTLQVGDLTTFVACAAGHRDQGAFEAARYGIDRLKEIVPVWKKEVGPDRTVWIEGTYQPTGHDNR